MVIEYRLLGADDAATMVKMRQTGQRLNECHSDPRDGEEMAKTDYRKHLEKTLSHHILL